MKVTVVVPRVFNGELENDEAIRELNDVQAYADASFDADEGVISFNVLRGSYVHADRRIHAVCLLANGLQKAVEEVHGVLRLQVPEVPEMRVATTTFDFDRDYMGVLEPSKALLVHVGIPVKGLRADRVFQGRDLTGSFTDIRVTAAASDEETKETGDVR